MTNTTSLTRRAAIAASAASAVGGAGLLGTRIAHASASYAAFLASVGAQARAAGVSDATIDQALALSAPNARVIALDRHQPEFTLTWSQYRDRVLPTGRLARGRQAYLERRDLFATIRQRFGVDPGVIIGIWGLESDFGTKRGTYGVFDSLGTLAFDGRRAAFFRAELLNALKIADRPGISTSEMIGSYAGAMGQPQFMPSAYLHYARAYDGGDAANIWTNQSDVFASIANYLAHSGWQPGVPWGQKVTLDRPIDPNATGRNVVRTLGAWEALGVRRANGTQFARTDVRGALLLPDGADGDAFMVYANFAAIRRYNPSDFYALGVGLLGDAAT